VTNGCASRLKELLKAPSDFFVFEVLAPVEGSKSLIDRFQKPGVLRQETANRLVN